MKFWERFLLQECCVLFLARRVFAVSVFTFLCFLFCETDVVGMLPIRILSLGVVQIFEKFSPATARFAASSIRYHTNA